MVEVLYPEYGEIQSTAKSGLTVGVEITNQAGTIHLDNCFCVFLEIWMCPGP